MQRKLAPSLAEILKEASAKNQENSQQNPDDLNILPLPAEQIVDRTMMMWVWMPVDGVLVFAKLYTKTDGDYQPGDWAVEMSIPTLQANSFLFLDDAPKLIGQALISAWNYQKIWKEHAGVFLERQLMRPDPEPETETAVVAVPEPVDEIEILEDPDEVEVVEEFVKRPPVELNEFMKQFRTPPGVIEGDAETIRTTPSFDNG